MLHGVVRRAEARMGVAESTLAQVEVLGNVDLFADCDAERLRVMSSAFTVWNYSDGDGALASAAWRVVAPARHKPRLCAAVRCAPRPRLSLSLSLRVLQSSRARESRVDSSS